MKFLPKNTLAYFNAAPQTHQHNLSDVPTAIFAEGTKAYRKTCGLASPNDEAVTFYTLNHCASIVRKSFTPNEPLPEWARQIMQTYTDVCLSQGERLLHYILSITTREMRHIPSKGETFWKAMSAHAGTVVASFIKENKTHDESAAVARYMDHPPSASVGQYLAGMSYGFWKGWGDYTPETMVNWAGGYGGPKWALVADALAAMITGTTSMEMLVDTGYTLAHNGGPIFNKGMMYTGYDAHFMTILDVQRSGQMLDLIAETNPSNLFGVKPTAEAKAAVALIKEHLPQEFKGYIDWKLVDELRPEKEKQAHPNKYVKHTSAQKQPMKSKPTVAAAEPAPQVMTTLLGKKVKLTGTWQVYPHQSVKTYERTGE